jgi:AcrR family transcriptional regulator
MTSKVEHERAPLNRRLVVDAALAIADREGLEAISIRRLGRELGVTPMALYRYVASKEELLGSIGERVFEEFELPPDKAAPWQTQLRELARSFRKLLVAHPAVAALSSAHPTEKISDNGLRVVEDTLRVLRLAGFSAQESALLETECERFVLGLVMIETGGGPPHAQEKDDAQARELYASLSALPKDMFPNVVEAAAYLCKHSDPDWAFEFALDVIIGGFEKLLEREDKRPAATG